MYILPCDVAQSSQFTFWIISSSSFTFKVTAYFLLLTLCSGHIFPLIMHVDDSLRKQT